MDKLSLEKFLEVKKVMLDLISLAEENVSTVNGDELLSDYNSLQEKLLSCDLSDIPFEEWDGLYLVVDNLDLSKTHANIDFSILKGVSFSSISVDGCNIKGIEVLDYDENTFSPEFMKSNPQFFPSKSLPNEIRKKYYDKKLDFTHLVEYPL